MASRPRLLALVDGQLWKLASVRSTTNNLVLDVPTWPTDAAAELRLRESHRTISRRTGRQHQTFAFSDSTALRIYDDGLQIQGHRSFGEALDALNRLRPLLEHWSGMLTASPMAEVVEPYTELFYAAIPSSFPSAMGFGHVSRRPADVIVEWQTVHVRLGLVPSAAELPEWLGVRSVTVERVAFDDCRDAILLAHRDESFP